MIKGNRGDWESYPVYHHRLFEEVKETYDAFPTLFHEDVNTPLGEYLTGTTGKNIWKPLRKNAPNEKTFIKSCTEKIDGLRILQFLKHSQGEQGYSDEECLLANLKHLQADLFDDFDFLRDGFTFDELSSGQLDVLRNALVAIEEQYQKEHHG